MVAIEDIYDAAFDRGRFPALVAAMVHAFGASSGYILWYDSERSEGFQAEFGNDPVWLQRYVETYARHDVLRPLLDAVPEGVCDRAWPHLQTPAVRNSRFYREFLAPQAIVDNLIVNLIKRPGVSASLALLRAAPAAPFTATDADRLAALVPHLRRAVYIQSHIVRAADRAASVRAFDGSNGFSLLLSADRIIVEIDAPLAQLLRLGPGQGLRDSPIGKAIERTIDAGAPVAIALTTSDGLPVPILCEARPLEQNRFGDLASGPAPSHAVHVTRLDRPRTIAFDAMAALYRLTPTELKVLRDAIAFGDLVGIGTRIGMAPATARTHLHRIYDKTGTRSFAALSNVAHRFGRLSAE